MAGPAPTPLRPATANEAGAADDRKKPRNRNAMLATVGFAVSTARAPAARAPVPANWMVRRGPRPNSVRAAKARPSAIAPENAANPAAPPTADAPSVLRRNSTDQTSIDPSTKNANRTTDAGTSREGARARTVREVRAGPRDP